MPEGFVTQTGDCDDNDVQKTHFVASDGYSTCDGEDDENNLIRPNGIDTLQDGIDQDCDGLDRTNY